MEFDKVTAQHIKQGIKDYEEKGYPDGFGPSSTYDVHHEGKLYPPKAIMAYANYHATGRAVENYFKGGLNKDCFKALERNGFEIVEKSRKDPNIKLYELKKRFLEKWPLDRLENMSLTEYTNLKKNSFCYEVEHVTRELGSIVGGSSYKFGIYKRNSNSEVKEESNRTTDGDYAWFKKYGEKTKEEAFGTIKSIIIKIALAAQRNDLTVIDDVDLGYGYKWKIAFLYGDFNSLNIFKEKVLKTIGNHLDLPLGNLINASDYHKAILEKKKPEQDYFNYTSELWKIATMEIKGLKKEFSDWLKGKENSNKISSYLRAIDILNEILDDDLYLEENLKNLQYLYDDLILKQKNVQGEYYYDKAPSYGNNGFYSASVRALKTFLESKNTGIDLSKNQDRKSVV